MHNSSSTPLPHWSRANDVWSLMRAGRSIAVIEPTWDDSHWFLFAIDNADQLVFAGAWRSIAALKVCLLLWARHNTGHRVAEEAPL